MRIALILGSLAVASVVAFVGLSGSERGQEGPPQVKPSQAAPKVHKFEPSHLDAPPFDAEGHAIEPYVLHRSESELSIAWRLNSAAASRVSLLTAGEAASSQESPAGIQHAVTFSGLQPATLYTYRVEGYPPREAYTLRADNHRSFAVIGHTHGTERMEHYPDTLLAARIEDFQPDFVVHAGDCVYFSSPEGWKKDFFTPFRRLLRSTPIYISPGNHDVGWPFVMGYDLRCFRELFPHSYPEQASHLTEDGFYQIRQGSIDFYFLSYVADMTMEGKQLPWLKERLRTSNALFRIVVFGGANKYYDSAALIEELKDTSIDLIINGDGTAPANMQDESGPIPRLVMGTRHAQPHPWLACTVTDHWAAFKVMYADGTPGETIHLHDKRIRASTLDLGEPPVQRTGKGKRQTMTFVLTEPIASNQVSGLQLRLKQPAGGVGSAWIFVEPTERHKKSERGFRSEYVSIGAKDSLLTFSIPQTHPIAAEPYLIKQIKLELTEMKEGCKLEFESAYLFSE